MTDNTKNLLLIAQSDAYLYMKQTQELSGILQELLSLSGTSNISELSDFVKAARPTAVPEVTHARA